MNILIFFMMNLLYLFLLSFDSSGNQRWGVCYELKYVACKDSLGTGHH